MDGNTAASAMENPVGPVVEGLEPAGVQPPSPSPSLANREVSWPMLLAAIVPLLGFVAWQGPSLWREWNNLQAERAASRASELVGYIGITPAMQYAERPENWMHDENNRLVLWSGWDDATGHSWFKTGKDDLNRSILHGPFGRDVYRSIDRPIVELNGGTHWDRLHEETDVAGLKLGDSYTVYPVTVLKHVVVVNDQVGKDAATVIYTPYVDAARAINAYDPVVDSTRLTFGTSGYYYGPRPILYDRSTESLWVSDGPTLTALTGHYKGTVLPRLASLPVQPWSSRPSDHPRTRLVVGADRSVKVKPLL